MFPRPTGGSSFGVVHGFSSLERISIRSRSLSILRVPPSRWPRLHTPRPPSCLAPPCIDAVLIEVSVASSLGGPHAHPPPASPRPAPLPVAPRPPVPALPPLFRHTDHPTAVVPPPTNAVTFPATCVSLLPPVLPIDGCVPPPPRYHGRTDGQPQPSLCYTAAVDTASSATAASRSGMLPRKSTTSVAALSPHATQSPNATPDA